MWGKEKQKELDKLLKEKEQHDNLVQQIDCIFAKIIDSINAGANFSIKLKDAKYYCPDERVKRPNVYEITLYE